MCFNSLPVRGVKVDRISGPGRRRTQVGWRRVRSGDAAGTEPLGGVWPGPATGCTQRGTLHGFKKLAAFTSVGRKICESSEGLLQGGDGTRTTVRRKFPAIRPTLVRPPNPEPYQGSPDAAASGFQRCKKERPMHQDHLLVEKFLVNHKRKPARNQQIFPGLRIWGRGGALPPGLPA